MLLAQSTVDFQMLLPYAVFGTFAAGAWLLLEQLGGRARPRVVERLDEFRNPEIRKKRLADETLVKKSDSVTRVLAKASPTLAAPLQPKTELEANQLKLRLAQAGFRGDAAVNMFLGLKIAGLVFGFLSSGVTLLALARYDQNAIMIAISWAGICFYIPDAVVMFITRGRKEQIFLGLPDALDLMVVCVEAGLGLDAALRKVAEEMSNSYRVLASEFQLANFQMQVGKTRSEVWHELGARSGVEDLRQLATILIQAEKFGTSVAHALRTQSDSMRTRRRQMAEEKAAKTAVKLIFPLVIFIFPGIFVVLVGPAAITMIREMFPMMGG